MTFTRNHRRWVAPIVVLAAVASLVALSPHFGFTKVSKAPVWTERPAAQGPQTPAPDWVSLSKGAKPAVVNISTSRRTPGRAIPDLEGRPGERSPEDFFKRFFEEAPRRPVRAVGSGFILSADGYIVTNNQSSRTRPGSRSSWRTAASWPRRWSGVIPRRTWPC